MTTVADASKTITAGLNLLKDVALNNPTDAVAQAITLFEQGLLLLGPVDAPALDPGDRAEADATAESLENAKFPKLVS